MMKVTQLQIGDAKVTTIEGDSFHLTMKQLGGRTTTNTSGKIKSRRELRSIARELHKALNK